MVRAARARVESFMVDGITMTVVSHYIFRKLGLGQKEKFGTFTIEASFLRIPKKYGPWRILVVFVDNLFGRMAYFLRKS